MITVPLSDNNWEIYSQLKQIDAEYQKTSSDARRNFLINVALKLCDKLEV